ncbi:acetyltransferase (GNAT) domain protein [Leptospira borgpetersenii serovar Pomona str. 200901868]|uniref:Acetyltransferase (GNAT) domain protein n=1 Tax=Leptospira borgpetersenii serovar Pomona str. 200901868 TaxID=1192866 RepID=M6W0A0_LEPBO|nr:acetyltransferase (GNAT) domain protein [Leptospira borgpetersenii serovar Pomona str. 200901868]
MKTHFAEFGYGLWALETKQTKEWVGFTGFLNVTFYASFTPAVEIGWKLNSSFWNRGYATEAASCPRALPEARMCSKSLTECKKMEDSFFKTFILI